MCEILTALKENNISISVRYYGSEDLATGWDIKAIVDNAFFFDSFYVNYPIEKINTLNDYIVYLFSLKFQRLIEMVPLLLQDDHKEIITELSNRATLACNAVNKGDIIKFINAHIEEIFPVENRLHDICDVTLELIKQCNKGIQFNVYDYLCSKYSWLVINNFDSFYKVIEANPILFEKLYPSGHLSDIQERLFDETLDIFAAVLNGGKDSLKFLVNERVSVLCTDVEALVSSITEENVLLCEGTVRKFTSFLQQIKHHKANDFYVRYKTVEEILLKKIYETGVHSQYEIPVEEIIKQFSSTKNWIVRLLSLTHSYVPDSNPPQFKSRLNFERDNTHHLMDICSTNIPTDSYFTHNHQMKLSVHASVGAGTMIGIMSRPEVYQDYSNLVISAITVISKQMQREDEHLCDDWRLLDQMLQTIIANRDLEVEAIQSLCYSAAMYACSFMEKILRLYYVDRMKGKVYVSVEKITLGVLLKEDNAEIADAFGSIQVKHLAFFMLKCGDKNVGHNYRNRLAHWSEMKNSMLTVSLVAELLWLFTDILNTVFAYYLGQPKICEHNSD